MPGDITSANPSREVLVWFWGMFSNCDKCEYCVVVKFSRPWAIANWRSARGLSLKAIVMAPIQVEMQDNAEQCGSIENHFIYHQ